MWPFATGYKERKRVACRLHDFRYRFKYSRFREHPHSRTTNAIDPVTEMGKTYGVEQYEI